jgi:hydrogenase nickel incorporation protein HypA/HybF
MHELSLALDLIERVESIAQKEKAAAITSIEVVIGDESGVDRDSFAFAFSEVSRKTLADGAHLVIKSGDPKAFRLSHIEVDIPHV